MVTIDDNTTQVALGLISLVGMFITAIFSFLSLRYASQAKISSDVAAFNSKEAVATSKEAAASSQHNSETLHVVHEQVNGLTRSRVEAEARIGDANAARARAEGRLEEMARAMPPPVQFAAQIVPIVQPPTPDNGVVVEPAAEPTEEPSSETPQTPSAK